MFINISEAICSFFFLHLNETLKYFKRTLYVVNLSLFVKYFLAGFYVTAQIC